jgi:hypothetical protein
MAQVEIQNIKVTISQAELKLIIKALNYHVTEEYDHESQMRTLIADLEG